MTRPLIRATPTLAITLALMLVACAPASPAPTASRVASASQVASASPSPSTAAPAPETSAPLPMGSSGASPAAPARETSAPTPMGSSGPSPAAPATTSPRASAPACPVTPQTGLLPSDRLVDLAISSTPTQDLLTFVFEAPSSPSPAGPARGTLGAAKPPFSFAGSGLPIDLLGQHVLQLRFSGMTIASESGVATYQGPSDAKPNLPALREAILYDTSEGVVGWYVGYNGPGCVALVREGNDVTVSIAHPEAPAG